VKLRPQALTGAFLGVLLVSSVSVVGLAQEGAGEPGHEHPGQAEPEHTGHKEAEEEGPGAINWFDFNNKAQPPYAALLINFALLLGIYYYFGRKPVSEALKNHRASVSKEIEEAQRMKREAEARAKTYQAKLQDLEVELSQTKLALEEAGKGERDRIVKEAEEKAVRMQRDASFLLEQETKQAMLDLQRETVQAALAAAETILKKQVTASDQERLAEEFLTSLEQRPAAGRATRAGGVQ
jgi:F-type H+-transporting ATPase subunit b